MPRSFQRFEESDNDGSCPNTPNIEKPLEVQTDALDFSFEGVLM